MPFERVRVIASDTARMGDSGSASASRLTYMSGNAVRGAAEKALAAWQNEDRPAVGEYVYLAPKTTPLDHDTGYGKPNFAYGYVAQAAFVAVDTETGEVRIERFVCADDVGKAINPQQVIGQIEGGVVQALGYALLEDFKTAQGRVLTDKLSTYLIPTVLDVPDRMDAIIVETPDPNGPFGARGMGEMPYLPAAAAVAAAVHDAIGVRFDEFPLTPERVWRGLREKGDSDACLTSQQGQICQEEIVMFKDMVLKTRSYRRFYEDVAISLETLRELVDLARLSASARNMQPLKYVLCCNRETNAAVFSTLAWAGYLTDWPGPVEGERPSGYIVVLGDTALSQSFGVDHGIAMQSILLGATEKGLGGCMIGSDPARAAARRSCTSPSSTRS